MKFTSILRAYLLVIACLSLSMLQTRLVAQATEPGELIVQLQPHVRMDTWLKAWNDVHAPAMALSDPTLLVRPMNVWLLYYDENVVNDPTILTKVWQHKDVLLAQFNHLVTQRAIPDDANFPQQWQYNNTGQSGGTPGADMRATEAWDYATGGNTLVGDTIVVAVLDDGIDVNHVDFQRNRWYNHAEIPNNGIDDDNNGYVDDYLGWNIIANNDNISGNAHGMSVAGIIGADGNNGIGVTGVNWDVKVMTIYNNFNANEAQVLSAYSYPLEQRLRYNQSGGADGAFVVATNASWGVDDARPEDAPIWCALYDTLGEAGILNCGATANANVNVDTDGDLPTNCPSNYLIGVTNTDHNDNKVPAAGYGAISIDLGAPGQNAYTLNTNNGYRNFGGTSSATPHVTATIALLYSVDCPNLMALTQADPGAAALLIREAILAGVDPVPSLAGITATGGRLNAANSVRYLLDRCSGCLPASSVRVEQLTDTQAAIVWNTNENLVSVDVRLRTVGSAEWFLVANGATSPLLLTGLIPCQNYEYQLQSTCDNGVVPFQGSRFFKTDGCCDAPMGVTATANNNTAFFNWQPVLAAQSYELRYRERNTVAWTNIATTSPSAVVEGVATCTFYEYQIRTRCGNETTNWTPIATLLTGGCGPCLERNYCINLNVVQSNMEFIQQVEVGGFFSNISAGGTTGYQDFGTTLDPIPLEAGQTYPIRLTPGFPTSSMFGQYWRIWLDTDHNGTFTSPEVVFNTTESSNQIVTGFLTIPPTANLGVTRMRVFMNYTASPAPCPFSTSFGEIEDYCVSILPSTDCAAPENLRLLSADNQSATVAWDAVAGALDYEVSYRSSAGGSWLPVANDATRATLTGLDSCETYTLRVLTQCAGIESQSYGILDFNTCALVSVTRVDNPSGQWAMAPNPFGADMNLQRTDATLREALDVVLHDALGRQLWTGTWPANQSALRVDTAPLPSGLYTIALYRDGQLWDVKRGVKE